MRARSSGPLPGAARLRAGTSLALRLDMTTTTNPSIPTTAEQMELAARAATTIGAYKEVDGITYRVVAIGTEVRFFQYGGFRFQGEIGRSAHVSVLRADLAKYDRYLPGGHVDHQLGAR